MTRILFLTEYDSLESFRSLPSYNVDVVALGFWCAEDNIPALIGQRKGEVLRLNDIIKDYRNYIGRAYEIANLIAIKSPSYRGVKPLLAWEEYLAESILQFLIIADFHNVLIDRYGTRSEVIFLTNNETQKAFSIFNEVRDRPVNTSIIGRSRRDNNATRVMNRLQGLANLVADARREHDWPRIFWEPLQVLDDRYRIRSVLWPQARTPSGGYWFYGSHIVSMRILRRHLNYLKVPARWVTNRYAATKGLPEDAHCYHIWQFAGSNNRKEHSNFILSARKCFYEIPMEIAGLSIQDFNLPNSSIDYIINRLFPFSLPEIDFMYSFLEKSSPEHLWVANQWGSEGLLVQVAERMGIPVTQVQHGYLDRHYAFSDIRSQRFLVWGQFWKEAIKADQRGKVEILNPGIDIIPADRKPDKPGKKQITFLTTPFIPGLFWNQDVALLEVGLLVKQLLAQGYEILIRAHPGSPVELWQRAMEFVIGTLPPEVQFSKNTPLEADLQKTDLAIMFFSTVFMNCIASGIPVIGLGWYPHFWQRAVGRTGASLFLDSIGGVLKSTGELLYQPMEPMGVEQFLARSKT